MYIKLNFLEDIEMKIMKCEHCGNVVSFIDDKNVPIMCCGAKMVEVVPNSVEAATEKHIPVITKKCKKVTVSVGSVEHPMLDVHHIEWITLVTTSGTATRYLEKDAAPMAVFTLADGEQVVEAIAYCNLHGFWSSK